MIYRRTFRSESSRALFISFATRDLTRLLPSVVRFVLDHILSGEATEVCILKVHDYLTEMGHKVRDGKIPLEDFIINKASSFFPLFLPQDFG